MQLKFFIPWNSKHIASKIRGVINTICVFVCLGFYFPFENFSLICRSYHRWKAAKFDLYSVLIAIEQWGFFSLLHHTYFAVIRLHLSKKKNPLLEYHHNIMRYQVHHMFQLLKKNSKWCCIVSFKHANCMIPF